MTKTQKCARDPQELEQLLISWQWNGDVERMVSLYEPNAVLDYGGRNLAVGRDAITKVFAEYVAAGRKFELGEQQAAIICGDLALTSTQFPDGRTTVEIARQQSDGAWQWVIDRFSTT